MANITGGWNLSIDELINDPKKFIETTIVVIPEEALEKREYEELSELHDSLPDLFTDGMLDRYNTLKKKHDPFAAIIIPMIRKMMPSTIAASIVGVQPMTDPAGTIFTMPSRYSKSDKI